MARPGRGGLGLSWCGKGRVLWLLHSSGVNRLASCQVVCKRGHGPGTCQSGVPSPPSLARTAGGSPSAQLARRPAAGGGGPKVSPKVIATVIAAVIEAAPCGTPSPCGRPCSALGPTRGATGGSSSARAARPSSAPRRSGRRPGGGALPPSAPRPTASRPSPLLRGPTRRSAGRDPCAAPSCQRRAAWPAPPSSTRCAARAARPPGGRHARGRVKGGPGRNGRTQRSSPLGEG
jgi:hypothetical protein